MNHRLPLQFVMPLRWLALGARVFGGWRDLAGYVHCQLNPKISAAPVSLRIKQLGGQAIGCRPGTSDAVTLWTTFYHQYHLPQCALPPKATIIDAGANVGYTMAHFASLYPSARIVGIEMDEQNCRLAQQNLASWNERCQIIPAALWSEEGWIAYSGGGESGLHIDTDNHPASGRLSGRARASTMDVILQETSIERVDYLKMDIEGAEYEILGRPAAWMKKIIHWNLEVHPPATPNWCINQLNHYGFAARPHPYYINGVIADRRQ